jgi:hypothetical protein
MPLTLRAKYAIHPNTFFTCTVTVEAESWQTLQQPFYGTCQIRPNQDATLSVGTQIDFDTEGIAQNLALTTEQGQFLRVTSQVQAVETQQGQVRLRFSGIHITPCAERRQTPRVVNFFAVELEHALHPACLVTSGTSSGLTLFCTTPHLFSGCSVGQHYTLILQYQGEGVAITGTLRHIHYDLSEGKLMMGLSLENLKKRQQDIVLSLLNPDFIPEAEKQLNTQISADKISANH